MEAWLNVACLHNFTDCLAGKVSKQHFNKVVFFNCLCIGYVRIISMAVHCISQLRHFLKISLQVQFINIIQTMKLDDVAF